MYKKIIIPIALYGCELWTNMTGLELNTVNRLQHYIVKKIQGFTQRTRTDISESMLGLHKLSTVIEIRKLAFLHKILSLDATSTTQNIFIRRYIMFVMNEVPAQNGFVPDICKILSKYGLHTFINKVLISHSNLPSKQEWKKQIKFLVMSKAGEQWTNRILADDEFSLFRVLHPTISPAIVYSINNRSESRNIMLHIAKIWARSLMFRQRVCSSCNIVYANGIIHFVSECTRTAHLRWTFVSDILQYGVQFVTDLCDMDQTEFTLKLLGAELGTQLDEDNYVLFLKRCYKFVYDCTIYSSSHEE